MIGAGGWEMIEGRQTQANLTWRTSSYTSLINIK
jgi:hypothetical protein